MPNVAARIREQLNVKSFAVVKEKETYDSEKINPDTYSFPVFHNKFNQFLKEGHKIGKIEPLFKRILDADIKVWREKFAGVKEPAKEDPKKDKKKDKKKPKEAPTGDAPANKEEKAKKPATEQAAPSAPAAEST